MRHEKKQDKATCNQQKIQTIEANQPMIQMFKLAAKNIKTVGLNMLKDREKKGGQVDKKRNSIENNF